MMNRERFSDHPIFKPQPVGSKGGAKPYVQERSIKAESAATVAKETPWVAAKIYRSSPIVNTNPPINIGGGSGMIGRIYQQIAPTPEELLQKKNDDRTLEAKIKNWFEFGKFI